MPTSADTDIIYRINDGDLICYVNPAYDAFAGANDGATAVSAAVLERSLWDFISDPTTRHLYREVLARVRRGRSVRIRFRCDSPTRRRLMEMDIGTGANEMVEFRVRTIQEDERPAVPLLDPRAARSGKHLPVCGWCKKVRIGEEWAEIEAAVQQLQLFEEPRLPQITHGICPGCYQEMLKVIES